MIKTLFHIRLILTRFGLCPFYRCPQASRKMGRAVWASLFFVTGITQTYAQSEVIHRQDTLDEVVVTSQSANRRVNEVQIGTEKVDVVTMSRLPAMLGERDIIKGLQLLPGVKSEADGLGGY